MPDVKILVVDDSTVACAVLRDYLESEHYLVDEAHNSIKALSKIYEFKPRIIILDILMPGMTGDKLVELLGSCKPETKIIMSSSIDDIEIKEDCLRKGAFAWIDKPVELENLKQIIEEALRG